MNVPAFSKTYQGKTVLTFPGYSFEPGQIYAVIGANGSGKSTLGRVICGLEAPDGPNRAPAMPQDIAYMPQKSFAFRMSVRKNVSIAGKTGSRSEALLSALKLTELAGKNAKNLSGGETEKMALARILNRSYGCIVLDEPTAAMDMESTLAAESLIVRYAKERNAVVILITHALQQAERISDEILFLHKGNLLESGPSSRVLHAPEREETKDFLDFYGLR